MIPENPQNYIKLRTGLDNKGRLKAELYNPTPRDVKSIVIAIRFRDSKGRIRDLKRVYKPVLPAGKKRLIDIRVKDIPQAQLSKAKFAIIGASLAD